MMISPELPSLDMPVCSSIAPLTPSEPEFGVIKSIAPLVVAAPAPEDTVTLPPVANLLVPAAILTTPPTPEFPEPTSITIDPPAPPVAIPVTRCKDPELPALEVPVDKRTAPLTPLSPAFAVAIDTAPLDFESAIPDVIVTLPPRPEVSSEEVPAAICTPPAVP
jgi:hypothetical protein